MCLAIPAQITSIGDHNMAEIDILGVTRHVSLDLISEGSVGDWVLVHAGFAIQVVDEEYAKETLEILKAINIVEMDDPEPLKGEV